MSDPDNPSPWGFLLGVAVFLGGAVWFVAAVFADGAVLWALGTNGLGAAVLIAWAGRDSLSDPESAVASVGGAAGTALLLYGLYLFGAGVVLVATAPWHGQFVVGLLYGSLAVVATLTGFVAFPTDDVGPEGIEDSGEN